MYGEHDRVLPYYEDTLTRAREHINLNMYLPEVDVSFFLQTSAPIGWKLMMYSNEPITSRLSLRYLTVDGVPVASYLSNT
ncbi:hypothetical protein M0804_001445 [Polistes exclamans]|nr:hypothetical protein M0804_001445 [Polistes exclamans]